MRGFSAFLALAFVTTSVIPSPVSASEALPAIPWIVAFRELPADLVEGGEFAGERIRRVSPGLDLIVVDTRDPARLLQVAARDPRVEFAEPDGLMRIPEAPDPEGVGGGSSAASASASCDPAGLCLGHGTGVVQRDSLTLLPGCSGEITVAIAIDTITGYGEIDGAGPCAVSDGYHGCTPTESGFYCASATYREGTSQPVSTSTLSLNVNGQFRYELKTREEIVNAEGLLSFASERTPAPERAGETYTPSDPLFPLQYAPRQIRADEAWTLGLGDRHTVAICVLDTGIDRSHGDFHWYRDEYDFVNRDPFADDDHGHGTHVAGIAVAAIGNSYGTAGITNAHLMVGKVLDDTGQGFTSDVAEGVAWCAKTGVETSRRVVISMSLGARLPSQTLERAIARAEFDGALLVAAAGNDGPCTGCVSYPASSPRVIAVTCTTPREELCHFSSTGPEAEIAAPGLHVLAACAKPTATFCKKSGTSMSAPHVSGVLALKWALAPYLPASALRDCLSASAQDLGLPGWDVAFGHGEVDAAAFVNGPAFCSAPRKIEAEGSGLESCMKSGHTCLGFGKVAEAAERGCTGVADLVLEILPTGLGTLTGKTECHDIGPSFECERFRFGVYCVGRNVLPRPRWFWLDEEGNFFYSAIISNNPVFLAEDDQARMEGRLLLAPSPPGVGVEAPLPTPTPTPIPVLPPTAPERVAAKAGPGRGEIQISWTRGSIGASPESYDLYRMLANEETLVARVASNTISFTDSRLGDGVRATYRVVATNTGGSSLSSDPASARTFSLPSSPANVSARTSGAGGIEVSWLPPADSGGLPILRYRIYRAVEAGGAFEEIANLSTAPRFHDVGLGQGDTRHYRVSAENSVGEGEPSATVTGTAARPPSAPRDVEAAPGAKVGEIQLTWSAPASDGGLPIVGYRILVGNAPGEVSATLDLGDVKSYTHTAGAGATRHYRVIARSSGLAGDASDEASAAAPRIASAPRDLSVKNGPGRGNAELRWNAPADDGGVPVTGYRVYRASAAGSFWLVANLGVVESWTDANLPEGATYRYRVTAVTSEEGAASADVTVTTPVTPGTPRALSVSAAQARVVKLTWETPSTGGFPESYRVYRATGTSTAPLVLVGTTTGLGFEDRDVAPSVRYFYEVRAVNLAGEGPGAQGNGYASAT